MVMISMKIFFLIIRIICVLWVMIGHVVFAQDIPQTQKIEKKQAIHRSEHSIETDFSSLGVFRFWEAFVMQKENETICWISSKPKKTLLKTESLLITSIYPMRRVRDEVSYHSGDILKTDKNVKAIIDERVTFYLQPEENWAWMKSTLDEGRFVLASQHGRSLTLKTVVETGKDNMETYSLQGYTDAYNAALKKCAELFHKKSKKRVKKNYNMFNVMSIDRLHK